MRKLLALSTALILCLSFAACGDIDDDSSKMPAGADVTEGTVTTIVTKDVNDTETDATADPSIVTTIVEPDVSEISDKIVQGCKDTITEFFALMSAAKYSEGKKLCTENFQEFFKFDEFVDGEDPSEAFVNFNDDDDVSFFTPQNSTSQFASLKATMTSGDVTAPIIITFQIDNDTYLIEGLDLDEDSPEYGDNDEVTQKTVDTNAKIIFLEANNFCTDKINQGVSVKNGSYKNSEDSELMQYIIDECSDLDITTSASFSVTIADGMPKDVFYLDGGFTGIYPSADR